MAGIDQEIRYVKGIGAARARDFARLGLATVKDVIFDFPFRYDDLSQQLAIRDVQAGQKVTVRGTVTALSNRRSNHNPRMVVSEAIVEDGTGTIKAVWFHQGFLRRVLKPGVVVSLSGKIDDKYGLSLVNPVYEIIRTQAKTTHTGRIVPVYQLAGALTQKIRRLVAEKALEHVDHVTEWLPEEIRKEEHFMGLQDAVLQMHFPASKEKQEMALNRLKFDEFFLHQIMHAQARRELQKQRAPQVTFHEEVVKSAIDSLPFDLTGAQKKALWRIIQDMEKDEPMNRLLEGDVGTGKTVIAALAAINAAGDEWQTALLAPTEILADQHAKKIHQQFGDRLKVALLTRTKRRVGDKEVTKPQMLEAIRNGKVELVIGTHALLSEDVLFNRLGLIIVDEQHRFGVRQRKALKDRQGDADGIPHLLSMTATPIPRSLALVLYGDLDRSLLDEYPAGRKHIETFIVEQGREERFYDRIRDELDQGRQAFVVCPLIEESDALGVQSVNEVYAHFNSGPFAAYRLAMLHGKLKQQEKDEVMDKFVNGEIDMIISTTVVEVGVDIPNATIMFIEGAERFGLAQLHQLRGRVGRGSEQSYCFLHPSGDLSDLARERLRAVVESQNGFELADKDLELRGPGNIFGTSQSGFEQFRLGTYADRDLISSAREWAKTVLDGDPDLEAKPLLKQRVLEYIEEVHFE